MKLFLLFATVVSLSVASVDAQLVLPTRPSGVVAADHSVVTRNGVNDYLVYAPAPQYPAGASGLSGRGVFIVDLSMLYGTANDVRVLTSTGSTQLDNAAIEGLRQWVFRHYTIYKAAVPVEFDASGRVHVGADPSQGPAITAILANMTQVPRSQKAAPAKSKSR